MASIYEQALGTEFKKLHPRIRERFGFNSEDRVASIGQGVMDRIWYSKWAAVPLYIGTFRHIMFPDGGRGIPFTIENFAYRDDYGRETVTWNRKFKFRSAVRRFDATMVYSRQRRQIVDRFSSDSPGCSRQWRKCANGTMTSKRDSGLPSK